MAWSRFTSVTVGGSGSNAN